ncbi:kinase-like domain-containing protein [Xylariaceae sp. FL1019]|nr:kinase-like domain-containing protein [Xylariaceae sp. FL1019]
MRSISSNIDFLNWTITDYDPDHSVQQATKNTNWGKLCQLASTLNNGLPCVLLDKPATNGGFNLVRLLEFSDGTRWIARIPLRCSTADSTKLQSEVDAMQLVQECSAVPIPKIFAYEVDGNNPIGVPFVLMEFLLGNTAIDAAGGWDVHKGEIPLAHRDVFYSSVAECHVQMTALRFSKIGSIVRMASGKYDIGPLPNIGGPFSTASSFFAAWADHAKFPSDGERILQLMAGGPAKEVLEGINEFPSRVKSMVPQLCRTKTDHGPFPLCHVDLFHSNIIVDDNFKTLGIIDWAGTCTVPWQVVSCPPFLRCMPVSFDLPDKYDCDGKPIDAEDKQRWKERQDYAEMVRLAERATSNDNMLSTCLSDEISQTLAYVVTAYENGKMGFYNRVMDDLERILKQVDY